MPNCKKGTRRCKASGACVVPQDALAAPAGKRTYRCRTGKRQCPNRRCYESARFKDGPVGDLARKAANATTVAALFRGRKSRRPTFPGETQIDLDNIKAEMPRTNTKRKVFFKYDGHTYHAVLVPNKILFKNDQNKVCIQIEVHSHSVELEYYYFKTPMDQCPHLPHDRFFRFLKRLGAIYDADVTLFDVSKKKVEHSECVIPASVFAFAGYRTFYQRYGFESPDFDEYVKYIQRMTFLKFNNQLDIEESDVQYKEAVRLLEKKKLDKRSTIQKISKVLVDHCKGNTAAHKKSTEEEAWLISYIADLEKEINEMEGYHDSIWTLYKS
jgi:hypothetical protein